MPLRADNTAWLYGFKIGRVGEESGGRQEEGT